MYFKNDICYYTHCSPVIIKLRKQGNKRLIFLVFSFFLVVNIASSGGHFDAWDGVETFLVTESMVLKHSAKLYPDVPSIQKLYFDINTSVANNKAFQNKKSDNSLEPMYTVRSLLLSAIAVPFYYAALLLSASPIPVVAILVNSLIISLTCVVVFCFSLDVYNSRKISFVLSLIFGVCSFIWPYITSLFPQPVQTLCIFTSAYFIYISTRQYKTGNIVISNNNTIITNNTDKNKKAYFAAGLSALFLGLSVIAHPTSALVIPGFIVYSFFTSRGNRKTFVSFLIVLAIMAMFISLINYWRFGSLWNFGYGSTQSLSIHSIHNGWDGLAGLIGSTGTGLIFFFPIAILFPLALTYVYRRNKWLFFISAYVFFVFWFFFGTISTPIQGTPKPFGWSGGGWGPRYLAPTLPFITLSIGALLTLFKQRVRVIKVLKVSTIILCAAGFVVNLLGVLVWYHYGYVYGWIVEQLGKLDMTVTDLNSMEVMTWNPIYSPIILHAKALMSGFVTQIRPGHDWTSYGLAPCPYDLFLLCKFAPTSVLILLAVIAILGLIIVNQIKHENDSGRLTSIKKFS